VQTLVTPLVTAGKETDLIGLAVAGVDASQPLELRLPDEALVVVLHGVLDVEVDGEGLGQAGGRANVFEAQADAVYLPPGASARFTAVGSGAAVAIATAPLADAPAARARIIRPADQRVNEVGQGNWARQVRTILGPEHEAGRLLVGETINPPGNWSSYPPHKHDEEHEGRESELEEIYYFEVAPSAGAPEAAGASPVGYQRVYGTDDRPIDVLAEVCSGDVVLVPHGWHGPAMAAPGYDLYYLNVMAGPGAERAWLICDDPAHGWVRDTWSDQPVDPRLPLGGPR
jgi:5-deoxy-glucuronate isomerase